jgi:hypothetical protein
VFYDAVRLTHLILRANVFPVGFVWAFGRLGKMVARSFRHGTSVESLPGTPTSGCAGMRYFLASRVAQSLSLPLGACPMVAKVLSDLGAEVIKME